MRTKETMLSQPAVCIGCLGMFAMSEVIPVTNTDPDMPNSYMCKACNNDMNSEDYWYQDKDDKYEFEDRG